VRGDTETLTIYDTLDLQVKKSFDISTSLDLNLHRTLLIAFNSIGARTYLGSVKIQKKKKIKEEKFVLIITYTQPSPKSKPVH
jgi:hypothetical protein